MDVEEEVSCSLPEHLVEMILAMLPFPAIFKVRCLSKSWLAKLSSISSQEDEESKQTAALFHKQVGQWSGNWRTFCPVFITDEVFTAYDRASEKWHKMPPLSFLPRNFLRGADLQMEGPLLYGFSRYPKGWGIGELYVVNMLTQSLKQLPKHPDEKESTIFCIKLVIDKDSQTYKVILILHDGLASDVYNPSLHSNDSNKICVQIYDSGSDAWITKTFVGTCDFLTYDYATAEAFLNGVLYIAKTGNPLEFLAFNLNEGTLAEMNLTTIAFYINEGREFRMEEITIPEDTRECESISLVVCNGRLFMIVAEEPGDELHYVREIDLSSRSVSSVTRYQNRGMSYFNPVSDGECILFLGLRDKLAYLEEEEPFDCHVELLETLSGGHVMGYSVVEDKFTFLSDVPPLIDHERFGWIRSCFQPGLTPFIAV